MRFFRIISRFFVIYRWFSVLSVSSLNSDLADKLSIGDAIIVQPNSSQTVTLAANGLFLVFNSTNASKLASYIVTQNTYIASEIEIMPKVGFTTSLASLNLTINNTTNYTLYIRLMRLA